MEKADRVAPSSPDITGWLDASGLAWQATRGELARRYGVSADNPYQWDLVELAVDPPPLAGLLRPFSFQAFDFYATTMPPGRLSTHVWRGADARDNLAWTVEQLTPALGPARITQCAANALEAQWRSGRALVRLAAYPADLQQFTLTNPAHERDPRLTSACSIEVLSGWRLPLSTKEQGWLVSSTPLAQACQPQSRAGWMSFAEPMLEYMRDGALPSGTVNVAGAGAALLVQAEDLLVLPAPIITGFTVSRLLPAKGGGGSSLYALCRRGDGGKDRSVLLAQRAGADDLNGLGEQLAAMFSKPLELEPYQHDC